jgi:uncharacterized protein YndB with AHSA1/START domain
MEQATMKQGTREQGTIERELHVGAPPEVVFEVITRPEHIREWWQADEAHLTATAGTAGELVWGDRSSPDAHVARLTVVEAEPPRRLAFRWVYDDDVDVPTEGNSLLVTFELTPADGGTTVRLTESGFRERGWEAAVLQQHYDDHQHGWDQHFGGGLRTYLERLVLAS